MTGVFFFGMGYSSLATAKAIHELVSGDAWIAGTSRSEEGMERLADSAYRLPDRYIGPAGITWLHRWALTRGMPGSTFQGEPEVPDWINDAATLH